MSLIPFKSYPQWRWDSFTRGEVQCRCGCGMMPEPYAMDLLQELRARFGKPLRITSAARCPEYNDRVSSTGLSGPHTTGTAFDIAVSRIEAWRLIQLATRSGWQGLGVSQKDNKRFIHIDKARETPTVWSY